MSSPSRPPCPLTYLVYSHFTFGFKTRGGRTHLVIPAGLSAIDLDVYHLERALGAKHFPRCDGAEKRQAMRNRLSRSNDMKQTGRSTSACQHHGNGSEERTHAASSHIKSTISLIPRDAPRKTTGRRITYRSAVKDTSFEIHLYWEG